MGLPHGLQPDVSGVEGHGRVREDPLEFAREDDSQLGIGMKVQADGGRGGVIGEPDDHGSGTVVPVDVNGPVGRNMGELHRDHLTARFPTSCRGSCQ